MSLLVLYVLVFLHFGTLIESLLCFLGVWLQRLKAEKNEGVFEREEAVVGCSYER